MSNDSSGSSKRDRRQVARARAAAQREAEAKRQRRRRAVLWSGAGIGVLVVVGVIALVVTGLPTGSPSTATTATTTASATAAGPEGIALERGTDLAADTTSASGASADGIRCDAGEGAAEHIHTHLAVYVDGALRPIPVGVGVVRPSVQSPGTDAAFAQATTCYYWLHVHAADGIVHVEAPTTGTYTLGQFFAVWRQPLSSTSVAGATGKQTVYVNGKVVAGDPSRIALGSREDIQIDVGKVVPFQQVDWSASEL